MATTLDNVDGQEEDRPNMASTILVWSLRKTLVCMPVEIPSRPSRHGSWKKDNTKCERVGGFETPTMLPAFPEKYEYTKVFDEV
jgi:hypothetical protein